MRADAVGAHHLRQDALAQAAVGDADPLGGKMPPDRLENRAARQNEVGPLHADAGVGGAFGVAHPPQPVDRGVDFGARQPQAVDRAAVVAGQIEMHAGDGRHRPRRAQQVKAAASLVAGDALGEGGQGFCDAPRHGGENLGGDVLAAEGLGERHDAEAQRFPGFDAAHRRKVSPTSVQPDDLRGAAADIEQNDRLGVAIGEFAATGDGQRGFGFTVDDLEPQPQALAHLVEELGAVFGGAASFRRDQARARDAARHHLVAANPQRLQRALDRGFAQPSGLRKPFA